MKTYSINYRHRDDGSLDDAFESITAKSLAEAKRIANATAARRGWSVYSVREERSTP